MSFNNFTTCKSHSFGGTYLELPRLLQFRLIVRRENDQGMRQSRLACALDDGLVHMVPPQFARMEAEDLLASVRGSSGVWIQILRRAPEPKPPAGTEA